MKKTILPICRQAWFIAGLAFLTLGTQAQSYFISFAGTGATTTVDSVKVENLTHSATVKLASGDILHLFGTDGINEINVNDESIQIKPNPTQGEAEISFYAKESGVAQLSIYDISGRKIIQISGNFSQGIQKYQLSGLSKGMYSINVSGEKYFYTSKLISLNTSQSEAKIKYLESSAVNDKQETIINRSKSTKATVPMAYVTGDNLRFTGYSCNTYPVVVNDVPTGSKTITFTYVAKTASIAGTTTICTGNNTTLTASGGLTYLWNTSATTAAITVNPGSTTTYTVTVSNGGACTTSASATVTVNSGPTALISGTTTICNGDNTTLTASGGTTYIWNTSATTAAITVNPGTTTFYTVTVSSGGACSATTSATVTVHHCSCPTSIVDIDGNTYNVITLGAQCWMKGNLKTTKYNDNSAIPNITDATTWGNCSASSTDAYCDYNNTPSNSATKGRLYNWFAATDARNICPAVGWHVPTTAEWTTLQNYLIASGYNYDGTLSGNKIGKAMADTISWGSSATTGAVGNTDYHNMRNATGFSALSGGDRYNGTFAFANVKTYWWATDGGSAANGAAHYLQNNNIDLKSITWDKSSGASLRCVKDTGTIQPPTASISGITEICTGGNTTLTASGGTSYLWNTNATTAAITVNPSTTTSYTVTVSSLTGTASASVTVTVGSSITPSISGTTTICTGDNTTLTASTGVSYLWNTNATTAAITVNPGTTTSYAVTVSNGGACSATTSVMVTVNPVPTASISGTTTINSGGSTTLTAIGGGTYKWNTTATTAAIIVNPGSTTTYTVTVSVANCAATASVMVTVTPCPSTITDIENNIYNIIGIGTQCWMKENLKTTKYNDNTAISNVTDATVWANCSAASTAAYCDYNNSPSNGVTYGHLYNWYAATDVRKICPAGWHVPSDAEWTTLSDYLTNNGYGYDGSGSHIGKSMAATSGWNVDATPGDVGYNQGSNNSSGFTALPGGDRGWGGAFQSILNSGMWWSSTENLPTNAWYRSLSLSSSDLISGYSFDLKSYGFSVRCLMDQ